MRRYWRMLGDSWSPWRARPPSTLTGLSGWAASPRTVNGDTPVEPNETFFVKLTAPSSGTGVADGTGRAVITNDDT